MRAAPGDAMASQATNSISENGASAIPPLERRVSLNVQKAPLKDVLAEMCRQAGLGLQLDADGLKLSRVSVDTPVTLACTNEPLQWAFARTIRVAERQGAVPDIYNEIRDGKLFVSSIQSLNARQALAQPDWLKGYGHVGKFDDETNALSVYVGAKADDEFLAKLKTLPKLKELDIEGTKFITPQGLAHLGDLPALETLNLYEVNEGNFGLGDAAMKAAAQIRTLRNLSVTECGVTDDGLRVLAGMTQLTALSLAGNRITDAGLKFLAGLTNLQQLDLSQTMWIQSYMQISDDGLKNLSNLTGLRELSIGGLVNVTDAGLKHLAKLTELRNFSFAGSAVTSRNIAFPHLQTLDFSGAQVTDATLSNIDQFQELQRLTLRYTAVTDATMGRIAKMKELRQLTIDSDYITDAGIAQLRGLPRLEHLQLRATQVSDASLRSLTGIKSLTRLDLHGSGRPGVNHGQLFTMDGLLQLRDLPDLRELWISNLELPEGYLGLRKLEQLRGLTLFFCNISDTEEELLKTLMPDTSVSAMSGGAKIVPLGYSNQLASLPDASIRVTGRAVDDVSGQPLGDCTLEFGADNPDKPGEVLWGETLPGTRMEVAGNNPGDKSWFWGESFGPGKVWARLLASGYEPTLLTPNPVAAPMLLTNLAARMKRGGDFHGVVLDYQGHPMPAVCVYLADRAYFSLWNGVENSFPKKSQASLTDATGTFLLPGGNGTRQRILCATADGQLFKMVPEADSSRNFSVTLPQPASLILRYDIANDIPEAEFVLNFRPEKPDSAAWQNLSIGFSPVAGNGGKVTLTNLSPGTYDLARKKTLRVGKGSRFGFMNWTNLALKSGETKQVEIVRPAGQTVRGQITGIAAANAFGAYVYAFADHATNTTADLWNHQQPEDMVACGTDGQFQIARLPTGSYIIVAMAYTEPRILSHSMDPEFFGVTKVTVAGDAPTLPVNIKLIPCTEANRMAGK
jgi:internalin A